MKNEICYGVIPLNLKTAVEPSKEMQDFELETLSKGADHSQEVKAVPFGSVYGSKDCVYLPDSTAVFRLKQEGKTWMVFLVHHKRGDYWGFPKGHWDEGESPQEVALRELKEESGLDVVKWLKLPEFSEQYQFQRNNILINKKVVYFPALAAGSISLQYEEISDGRWVDIDKALELLTFDGVKQICKQLVVMLEANSSF